jgi:hypothetical protein
MSSKDHFTFGLLSLAFLILSLSGLVYVGFFTGVATKELSVEMAEFQRTGYILALSFVTFVSSISTIGSFLVHATKSKKRPFDHV